MHTPNGIFIGAYAKRDVGWVRTSNRTLVGCVCLTEYWLAHTRYAVLRCLAWERGPEGRVPNVSPARQGWDR